MGTKPLDVQALLNELNGCPSWDGMPIGTLLGHIHLHIGYLEPAVDFYRNILGLNLMASLADSAAFLSADGYHHHVGINTWHGKGAQSPRMDATDMRYFTIELPNEASRLELLECLDRFGIEPVPHDDGFLIADRSHNKILIR